MRHFLPVLAIALAACCLISQTPAAKAAGVDSTQPNNINQGSNIVYCNCTEWSCPRSSNYFCPPGPTCQHSVCKPIVAPDGSACRVSNKCEVNPGTCVAGVCKGKYQVICPANLDECKVNQCSTSTGNCDLVSNKPDGTACTGGSCIGGDCVPNASPKPPRNNPPPSPKPCKAPKNPCKISVRDPKTGKCKVHDADDGTHCDDRDKCTVGDVCKSGRCKGRPRKCKASDNPCKQSSCDSVSGKCKLTNLPDDTKCPNGTCTSGVCTVPVPQSCPIPKDTCKISVFDPATQKCVEQPGNENGPCNDGLRCTTDDKCKAGVCTGTPVTCPDSGNTCMVNQCNKLSGQCQLSKADDGTKCDDGLFCTVDDICVNGMCSGNSMMCTNSPPNQCQQPTCDESKNTCTLTNKMDGTACSTGSANGKCVAEACMGGQCVVSTSANCSLYSDACNIGTCNPATGECYKDPKPDDTPCEDGLFCTTGTTCKKGVCQGGTPTCPAQPANSTAECGTSTVVCSEMYGGQCLTITDDPCSKLDDQCNVGVCDTASGKCTKVPANNSQPCDDGFFCTTNDKCNCGKCQGQPVTCPTTSTVDQCKKVVCSESGNGTCTTVNQDNGYACDTGSGKCSSDTCQNGVCTAGPAQNCSAFNGPCTQGLCNAATGQCYAKNLADNTTCDDGKFCTDNTVCIAGACTAGTEKICTPSDMCQVATCDPTTQQCVSTPVDCSHLDGPCTQGKCNPSTGCYAVPANLSMPCSNPDLFCKVQTTCQADGSCGGGVDKDCSTPGLGKCQIATCDECAKKCNVKVKDCTEQGDQCNAGSCDSDGDGQCTRTPYPNGTACNDNNDNTCNDVCTNGVCAGTAQDCQSPPATCQDTGCPANMCCCGDSTKQCVPKLANNCNFTCAEQACSKAGMASGLTCNCIKSCGVKGGNGGSDDKSANCDSRGGNECAPHGVCCCAVNKPQSSVGVTYEDSCPNCETPCPGKDRTCTGNSADTIASICKAELPDMYPKAGASMKRN